jgi:hypothetical protein
MELPEATLGLLMLNCTLTRHNAVDLRGAQCDLGIARRFIAILCDLVRAGSLLKI